MKRREFITLLGGAAATWPLAARGQQPAMPIVGYLSSASLEQERRHIIAFRQGLKEGGYVEGQNVAIDFRSAEDHLERLPALASDFVRRPVKVIFAASNYSIRAAKAATSTVPIVFGGGFDPVALGFVASLNRPGGNITGVTFLSNALEAKRLGLLRTVVPRASTIGILVNPDNISVETQSRELKEAARVLGLRVYIANAKSEADFEPAFARIMREAADALLVATDVFLTNHRDQLIALAASHAIPAVYGNSYYTHAGGLMSYGALDTDAYRAAAIYVARILKGEKPADLPVMLPTKFELAINLKTAKTLGLTIPDGLLLAADQVIE